jgi:transcriptional regulator with XRE-family HTH domain
LGSDPTTFAARLRCVIDVHGGASSLARVIARSEGAVRKWLRAESEPNVTDLRAICEATATDIEWLVTGRTERARASASARAADERAADFFADHALLETLLERVDTELTRARLSLAANKRAALIVTLYQLSHETRTIDPDVLARLVKLAQA